MKNNIIFMGTPDFAVPCFEKLINDRYNIPLVVSRPDKPKGRKQVLGAPPVKELALKRGIEVYQPVSLRTDEAREKIAGFSPDFLVVAAYGNILPKKILDIPKYGCVNVHGSLLPKYRGAAPIQHSILNGDRETGITTMLMNEGIDEGDILLAGKTAIGENETAGELFDRLASMAPEILIKTLIKIKTGEITPIKQDNSAATFAPPLNKEMSYIDRNLSAEEIHNKIRALNPWPAAKTEIAGINVKIYQSLKTEEKKAGNRGFYSSNGRLYVSCGDGMSLEILELQPENGKKMTAAEFINGRLNNL
ncbi:MAG: methionyl-tRNA formyltransferase [Oscillospiraceae bacterium]|nr:methionyl-tRNA formyltransferase [Oscillospiraceae bacterium]